MNNIQFIDLQAQRAYLGCRIDDAIARVLAHGRFIMGPEVKILESRLSEFSNMARTVSCSSGTDALLLPLMAWNIGPGDAVFVPSFTFASTAEMVALLGGIPVFVDISPDSFNIDPGPLNRAIDEVKKDGALRPRAVIAVDLFGQIADYPELKKITDAHSLKLIADAAQGYGSTLGGKQAGFWADAVTTSFFPAKPLGCYGDGGAVLTNDASLADTMAALRVHGKGADKYDNVLIGINGRMDTLQAAIVIEKLAIFGEEIEKRNLVAGRYEAALKDHVGTPRVSDEVVSSWAQYTLIVDHRDRLQARLKDRGVPTAIYYPKPLHMQTAYKDYPVATDGLPVSEEMSGKVLSLPMHPYMAQDVQNYIISSVLEAIEP